MQEFSRFLLNKQIQIRTYDDSIFLTRVRFLAGDHPIALISPFLSSPRFFQTNANIFGSLILRVEVLTSLHSTGHLGRRRLRKKGAPTEVPL